MTERKEGEGVMQSVTLGHTGLGINSVTCGGESNIYPNKFDTLLVCRALKQVDIIIKCDSKINQVYFISNMRELSLNIKVFQASNLE